MKYEQNIYEEAIKVIENKIRKSQMNCDKGCTELELKAFKVLKELVEDLEVKEDE